MAYEIRRIEERAAELSENDEPARIQKSQPPSPRLSKKIYQIFDDVDE